MQVENPQNGVFGTCAPDAGGNSGRAGIAPVIGAAMAKASADLAASQPVQDELFEPAGRFMTADEAREERKRGRGRPQGAANKSSGDLRKYLQHQGVDPHLIKAQWLTISPEEMAARLRCTVLEAYQEQQKLAESLMPYVRAKLAPVDDHGNTVPFMVFNMGGNGVQVAQNGMVKPPYVIEGEAMGLEYEVQGNQWVRKLANHSSVEHDESDEVKP